MSRITWLSVLALALVPFGFVPAVAAPPPVGSIFDTAYRIEGQERCVVEWYPVGVAGVDHFVLEHDAIGVPLSLSFPGETESCVLSLAPGWTSFSYRVMAFGLSGVLVASTNEEVVRKIQPTSPPVLPQSLQPILGVDIIGDVEISQFPILFFDAIVDSAGRPPANPIPDDRFSAFEDDRLQTDLFDVFPRGTGILDFVLCMDNSGSMCGEISEVVENVQALADSLARCQSNVAFGYVRFGQTANNGCPIVTNNGVLLTDVEAFKNLVQSQSTCIGGTEPGLCAVRDAITGFLWRPGSTKHILLITDEDHDNVVCGQGSCPLQDVCNLANANGAVVHSAIDPAYGSSQADYWNGITACTGGLTFITADPFEALIPVLCQPFEALYTVRYRTDNGVLDCTPRVIRLEVSAFDEMASDTTSYVSGGVPDIARTPATVALSDAPQAPNSPLAIEATIVDCARPVTGADLFYRTTGTLNYAIASMTPIGGDLYRATIPPGVVFNPGVDYYLRATDGVFTITDPASDPVSSPYQIPVFPNDAPEIVHTPVTTSPPNVAVPIEASVIDSTLAVDSVTLFFRRTGTFLYDSVGMVLGTGTTYVGEIPVDVVTMDGVDYYIRAVDNYGVGTNHGTPDAPHQIEVGSNQLPICDAGGPYSGNVCTPIDFEGTASDPDGGSITSYLWDFGDGETALGSAVTHVYRANEGDRTHRVRLTVTDDEGGESSSEVEIPRFGSVGTISGLVRSLVGDQPVSGIEIKVVDRDDVELRRTQTDGLGRYSLTLPTGLDYAVICGEPDDPMWWDQVATGITLCPINPPRPTATRNVNFTLVQKRELWGIVRTSHDGFRLGKTTNVTITFRPRSTGTYHLTAHYPTTNQQPAFIASRPFPIRLELTSGVLYSESFTLREQSAPSNPPLDPIPITFGLCKTHLGQCTFPTEDTDILLAVIDSPLSVGGAPFDDRVARSLLERFQPVFIFNEDDPYLPKDVDIMLDRSAIRAADDPVGEMPPTADRGAYRGLITAFPELQFPPPFIRPYLDLYGDGVPLVDPLGLPGEYDRIQDHYPERIYGTAVNYGGRAYLSYWCFHFFENWFPCALHEGDWEGVTVELDWTGDSWEPAAMIFGHHPVLSAPPNEPCTQSFQFEKVPWADLDTVLINGRPVPKVYVAKQVHGTYPRPGQHRARDCRVFFDEHNGDGRWVLPNDAPQSEYSEEAFADLQLIPRFDEVSFTHPGRWLSFEGSFGNHRYGLAEVAPPRSPLFKPKGQWSNPARWIQNGEGFLNCETPEGKDIIDSTSTPPSVVIKQGGGVISMELAHWEASKAVLEVVDVAGRVIAVLSPVRSQDGHYRADWSGAMANGRTAPSGIYFYRVALNPEGITAGKFLWVR